MEWKEGTPQYGDAVRVKVSFYYHYGIFADQEQVIQFGLPDNVTRPAADIRVLSTDIYTFLQGGEVEVGIPSKQESARRRSPKQIVEIARSRIGENGYDVLHNNCEHFVYECTFGEKTSGFLDEIRERVRRKLGKST